MRVTWVDDQVHVVRGTNVNWALVEDGSSRTQQPPAVALGHVIEKTRLGKLDLG